MNRLNRFPSRRQEKNSIVKIKVFSRATENKGGPQRVQEAIGPVATSAPLKASCRGAEYVSACQHCWQALFLFCQALSMRDPKWPKNYPKWPKNYPKWPKNYPKWQKMTQHGKKWPKITLNGPKWPNMAQKWPKMAQNGPKMTFLKCRDLRVLPGTNFLLPGT